MNKTKRWSRVGLVFAAMLGAACAGAEDDAGTAAPLAFCETASTCLEFCLCATGKIDGCFEACDGPGGGGGSPQGTGGVPSGTGGAPGAGGVAAGGSPAAGGAPSAGGGPGSGGAPAGSGGNNNTSCSGWPGGASGPALGQTLPQSLSWQGFTGGSGSPSSTNIADYYDCDGKKGINAILFITATTTCGICKSEAKSLEAKMDQWAPLGIKVVTLMVYPATVAGAQSWKSAYGLNRVDVLADKMPPSMAYSNSIGTPLHTIVNPRNMQVVHTKMGGGSASYAKLVELAQQNQ
ncbi:MAG TPA: redoxin domain-containing protein [Polyangiaceae bacterium]|nr:redoxin domain-containing protein [Polyangiaceae bacterium]